jgi:hypothetical protein
VAKYCIARQVTDDSIIPRMRIACRMTKTRMQTHALCNTCSFFTATLVTPTRRSVTLYYSTTVPVLLEFQLVHSSNDNTRTDVTVYALFCTRCFSTQVFLGFPGSYSKCWDDSRYFLFQVATTCFPCSPPLPKSRVINLHSPCICNM